MNNVIDFLTSTQMIVVYIVALVAIVLCISIYIFDKNSEKRKQKQNTRELKRLVENIDDDIIEEKSTKEEIDLPKVSDFEYQEKPIILEKDEISIEEEKELVPEIVETATPIPEMTMEELNENKLEITAKIETIKDNELTYTTNEPTPEAARDELARITEMLEQEASRQEDTIENTIQTYEEEQEKNAIISMDELIARTKELELNKKIMEIEDQTAPISLDEFEKTIVSKEPVVEPSPLTEAIAQVTKENEPIIMTTQEEISINDMKQDESIKEIIEREKQAFANKFKSSPIISPIYGVEKEENNEQLELENTANYEKLDAEIKKTNEFLSKLKELQKKLD